MRSHRFNRSGRTALGAAVAVLLTTGCDFLDPTNVTNPNTTTADLAEAAEPTAALMPGVKAQMARAVRAVVQTTALVSDDYEIAFTNVGPELSDPYAVQPDGASYNSTDAIGAYWNTQELRALADFVIDTNAPGDDTATDEQLAEAHYYRGMAFLMQGENFIAVPTAPDTAPTPWGELLGLAASDFTAALALGPDAALEVALTAALARTHRALGNVPEAISFAQDALALDDEFVFSQRYSEGEIENPFANETRAYQPLPRLDFLDPKYTTRDAPIALAKAEEMHLILAEAEMVGGTLDDYVMAAGHIQDALELAATRPTGSFDDADQRLNPDLSERPSSADMLVAAEPGAPFQAGLVLDRPGVVKIPLVSGSSLDAATVGALVDPTAIRHALWLARQEILFLEGRRVHDLGVRMPVALREIESSSAITEGDASTVVQVPSYIPNGVIDDFSPRDPYAASTNEITIDVDMNSILAEERVSPFGTLSNP